MTPPSTAEDESWSQQGESISVFFYAVIAQGYVDRDCNQQPDQAEREEQIAKHPSEAKENRSIQADSVH